MKQLLISQVSLHDNKSANKTSWMLTVSCHSRNCHNKYKLYTAADRLQTGIKSHSGGSHKFKCVRNLDVWC